MIKYVDIVKYCLVSYNTIYYNPLMSRKCAIHSILYNKSKDREVLDILTPSCNSCRYKEEWECTTDRINLYGIR